MSIKARALLVLIEDGVLIEKQTATLHEGDS